MRLFRVYIYLSVYNFFKGLLSPEVKDQKISKVITKMSKKKILYTHKSTESWIYNTFKISKKKCNQKTGNYNATI